MHARKSLLSLAVLIALSGSAFAASSTVITSQNGDGNNLNVDQGNATNSSISISQNGTRNGAGTNGHGAITQTATNSSISITQTGSYNRSDATQAGNNSAATIVQNGAICTGSRALSKALTAVTPTTSLLLLKRAIWVDLGATLVRVAITTRLR